MQEFYLLVKFGLVLIYIWKVYRKRSSSILSTKNMFNQLLAFFLRKTCTFSNFERLHCWKSRNYSQHSSLKIFFEIFSYLESLIIRVEFSHYTWTCGAFSLVCVISIFFFFLSFCFFFFFYLYFPWQTLTIHKTAGTERVSLFLLFLLLPAHEYSFGWSRFLPLLFSRSFL